jgi:Rieske Fe-S protein
MNRTGPAGVLIVMDRRQGTGRQGMTDENPTTRRALLLGAGAVGATAVLAACGGDEETPQTPGAQPEPTAGGQTSDGSTGGGQAIGKVSEVPVGGGAIFAGAQVVVTQPTEGTFKAFRSICTHQGCPIASVDGGTINCSCHGSKFSLEDGSARNGPATRPLTEVAVTVEGDDIVRA